MNIKPAWKYIFVAGVTLAAIVTISASLLKPEPKCFTSQGQTVVKWKAQYWPCRHWWSMGCRRKHHTYKVTVNEGIPMRDGKGMPIVVAGGKIRNWEVFDSTAWNGMKEDSWERKSFPDYEPVAQNEYVVMVQTRYWLFHNVEASLRICTQEP